MSADFWKRHAPPLMTPCLPMHVILQAMFDVDVPITRHPSVDIARAVGPGGKEASTSFAVIASNPDAILMHPDGPDLGGIGDESKSSSSLGTVASLGTEVRVDSRKQIPAS